MNDRIATGSLGERFVMRTRGSMRETLTKAIRSTLKRATSNDGKSRKTPPKEESKFATSLTATTSIPTTRSYSTSRETEYPYKESSSPSRSSSSTPQRSSSGFSSMSHLPPAGRKYSEPFSSSNAMSMSQSMYISGDNRSSKSSRNIHDSGWLERGPSLATLKDHLIQHNFYDEDFDDDVNSVVSSASTSRIFGEHRRSRTASNFKKQQSLRMFVNSPIRLRKRMDSSRKDAVEAGFEPENNVPRCHSTQSLRDIQFNRSQFQASELSLHPSGLNTPVDNISMAPVHPRMEYLQRNQEVVQRRRPSYCEEPHKDRRNSFQAAKTSSLYHISNQQWSSGTPDDMSGRVSIQPCDSTTSINDQRRSQHQLNSKSFMEGISHSSTPKNRMAVQPLKQSTPKYPQGSSIDRRDSIGLDFPAYNSMVRRHGEERLVDGPIVSAESARVAYLEKKLQELEAKVSQQQPTTSVVQLTPVTQRHMRTTPSHQTLILSNATTDERIDDMNDRLHEKDKKVKQLESKLLKAYTRIERQNEDYEAKIDRVMKDSQQARDDASRLISKIHEMEEEIAQLREVQNDGSAIMGHELVDMQNQILRQEREIQENRRLLAEKEDQLETMKLELNYSEIQNSDLENLLKEKKKALENLENQVKTVRREKESCKQSCSSGSTPIADDTQSMADAVRMAISRPYTKAKSNMGSHTISPTPYTGSVTGLSKSISSFAIDGNRKDEVSGVMSRSIRSQGKELNSARTIASSVQYAIEKLARGEQPDVFKLLGGRGELVSESEIDVDSDEEEVSKPFSAGTAEKMLLKQQKEVSELKESLEAIRHTISRVYEKSLTLENGDLTNDTACRVQ